MRVHAASLNPLDWKIRAGHLRWLPMFRRPPRTLGCDFAGEIVGVGAGARSHYVGERVFGSLLPFGRDGALAEYIVARRGSAGDDAGRPRLRSGRRTAGRGGTALQALVDEARLGAGQRILITGAAGGVGHFAVQIAKHLGAHVVAVCGAANADFVRGLGADEVVDYARDDFTRRADRFDVVFDAAVRVVVRRGAARAHRHRLLHQHRRRCGRRRRHRGGRVPRAAQLAPARGPVRAGQRSARWERLAALAREGVLRPHIERTIALEDVADAQRAMETGHGRGKIVVRPSGAGVNRVARSAGPVISGPPRCRRTVGGRKPRRSRTNDAGTVKASAASMPSAFGTASRSTAT